VTTPTATEVAQSAREVPFEFRGVGSEFFKIWIVNIMLTIITLGIYSAWATVRTNRYFYANTYLDSESFRYLADPITILKGRLIAVAGFIFYFVASNLFPVVGVLLAIALLFALPFFVIRSIAFSNRMTAYRNVQFRFKGTYGGAFMALLVWPMLGVLTLGILYPLALLKANQFVVSNCAYGATPFSFEAKTWDYGKVFLLFVGMLAATAAITFAVASTVSELASGIVAALGYILALGYITVSLINIYYNATSLGPHLLSAHLETVGYLKIFVSNAILTVLTLGLYLPFAQVRMSNYRASHTTFLAEGSLSDFAAAEQQQFSALGDQLGEVFGFDVGAF
jgi:uncharacterized membrane protein YjgN (DUF898 family)